ncbi:TetR/AcrR family transcriptional regulator [Burkholderia sp. Ac-20379]|uniref:TetR/AcrR family transcriptional regulator n=1 Tax=Burkholderia sp. Ac-20379 TaxID=2703900 RepID=UPI00197D54FF|nr:TetR/AcrR family transcriptional regulator [Burkholderia sp. Ac-20379]MBN3725825.1 TetR/AcrR family transcriptional regulator [Burkholderia sp. Ac-20379]
MSASSTKSAAASRRTPTSGASAHTQLIDAAEQLFYREGVRAVGIDAVVERAGVNKMSLYRQFSSKDELVLAYIERKNDGYFGRFDRLAAQWPDDPKAQLLAYVDELARRTASPDYRGCPFVNVAVEFPDAAHPARVSVADNKSELKRRLIALATGAGARDPLALADSIALVIEGVYAASQTYRADDTPVGRAPQLVRALIDAACA